MKKLYTLSFILLAVAGFAQTYIPFAGSGLLNANGWATHSGTAGQLAIVETPSDNGNSLSYPGLVASTGNRIAMVAGNSEDVNFPLTATLTTGTVYYSALVKVLDAAQLDLNSSTIGSYGLALTSVVGASTTAFQARIYTKQGATPNTFVVGVLNNSGGTATPSFISTDLAINTTHLLVVKYDLATNTASLIVNPTPGDSEPTASATNATGTTAAPATGIAGIIIREVGTSLVGSGNVEIDEIRIGDNFSFVTPSSLGTKQNSISGLNVYPNPVVNGNLFITSNSTSNKGVVIFDVLGKQVLKATVSNQAINVSSLNRGVYIVKITEEGKTATRKLVIK